MAAKFHGPNDCQITTHHWALAMRDHPATLSEAIEVDLTLRQDARLDANLFQDNLRQTWVFKVFFEGIRVQDRTQFARKPQTIVLLLVEEFLALGKFNGRKLLLLGSAQKCSSGTGTVSLQNQPARKISQNRSIYNDLQWCMECLLSSCSCDMFHNSFQKRDKCNPSPTFSQVALFDTIAFPQFGRQLAPGRLELTVKIRELFPQHGGFQNLNDFP